MNETTDYHDLSNYEFIKTIGKGNYGKVILTKCKLDNTLYAIKSIKKELILKQACYDQIKSEKKILSNINHPFIIKLHHNFQTKDKIYFIFEYGKGGDMFFHLQKVRRFSENEVKIYAAQLFLALEYLHNNNILYRDIKPENIIMDCKGNIKLIDFGLAKYFESESIIKTLCGTKEYIRNYYLI